MSSAHRDSLLSFFSNCKHIISLIYYIVLGRFLARGWIGHPCPVPDLRLKSCTFSILNMMLDVDILEMFNIKLKTPPLLIVYWVFSPWIFTFFKSFFSASVIWLYDFLLLADVMGYFDWILDVNHPRIPVIHPLWSWCINLSISTHVYIHTHRYIIFGIIMLRVFASIVMRNINL